jgi:hypothetical protein
MEGPVPTRIENARVLVLVKSYPRPSVTHGETDCVAGLLDGTEWIRLYPVLFRQLPRDLRFDKWQWITCSVTKNRRDPRVETWQPDHDRLAVGTALPYTAQGWATRWRYLQNLRVDTLEQLRAQRQRSLGWIKPTRIDSFEYEEEPDEWPERYQRRQVHLWGDPLVPIERIPVGFYARFTCDAECPGHRLSIIDWEIYQLYRNTRSPEKVLEKLYALRDRRALSFFVGTALRSHHYGAYMIIGLCYPPRTVRQVWPGFTEGDT